jgi:hypothetical protein
MENCVVAHLCDNHRWWRSGGRARRAGEINVAPHRVAVQVHALEILPIGDLTTAPAVSASPFPRNGEL